jgi:NADP-dependent 3-hydroxy acid dehydrogenase YdfG
MMTTVAMLARREERLDELATELDDRAFGVDCDVCVSEIVVHPAAQVAP